MNNAAFSLETVWTHSGELQVFSNWNDARRQAERNICEGDCIAVDIYENGKLVATYEGESFVGEEA